MKACPTPTGSTSPAERCMGQKAVTRNRSGRPAQHSCEWATTVKARSNRRQSQPAQPGWAGSKRTRRKAGVVRSDAGFIPDPPGEECHPARNDNR